MRTRRTARLSLTLRHCDLRRLRTLKAAAASVVECRGELAHTAQAVWLQSERSMIVLHNKASGLHQHSEELVKTVLDDLDQELQSMEENLPGVKTLEDNRVSYVNYWHGELKNLIFGTPLVDYPLTVPYRLSDTVAPPLIVTKSIEFIETHAINLPGIYRSRPSSQVLSNWPLPSRKMSLASNLIRPRTSQLP